MKLLIINGSPHKAGTTALLTDYFVKGAKEKGHEIQIFHAAQENVTHALAVTIAATHLTAVFIKTAWNN